MPKDNSADLMQALIAKLYATVTGDSPEIKIPRNKFVTWLLPGIPFSPEDFLFCTKGFVPSAKDMKEERAAEAVNERYHQAFVLSKLFDFVPDINNQFCDNKMQQTVFSTTQDSISQVYGDVLKYSRVVHKELSDKEKQKLQKFRNLLSVTKEVEDIVTEEKKTVTEPGPLTIAYNTYMNNYIEEADEYMNLLIDAQSATGNDPEAIRRVQAFANKSKFAIKKMQAAEMAWVAQGYKNEYEQITAYINQVTMKSMVLYKQDLLFKYNRGVLTSPADGGMDFYYTTLLPGNFSVSPGWTEFNFYEGDFKAHYKKNTSKWGASGGVSFGLFSIGAKAGGSKVKIETDRKTTGFKADLEFIQVPICRPWFEPGFFFMRAWTLDNLWHLNYGDKKVSDGKEQPVGRLVAYPVQALFVRNVKLQCNESQSHMDYVNKQFKAGGSVGWGPFRVGGSYSKGEEERNQTSHVEGGAITIDGMQLIGFINNIIPKCPDPHPDIKPEDFVGGED